MDNSPFTNQPANLTSDIVAVDRQGVDSLFSTATPSTSSICIICSNPAEYRLVPKHKHLNTAEIQDKGYACTHCIQQQYISPTDYALKKI